MKSTTPYQVSLIDDLTGDTALKLSSFADANDFSSPKQFPCFSMLLILKGSGDVIRDGTDYPFHQYSLLTFSLYQSFMVKTRNEIEGILIQFIPGFFCLFQHRQEVSCNGVLFNNLYDTPAVQLTPEECNALFTITEQMRQELEVQTTPDRDALLSYLKIVLINASRVKLQQQEETETTVRATPLALTLKETIESNYRNLHNASAYADLLHATISTLNRVSKAHFKKTLSGLIADRLIIEAKRELYLTSKPVKQIAAEIGFDDMFYFSRFFRKHTGIAPQTFRERIIPYSEKVLTN